MARTEPMTDFPLRCARHIVLAAAALTALVAFAVAAGAQPRPVARLTCGAYEAVPSGASSTGQPSRLSIQRNARLLLTVSDWSITRVECTDFNRDKAPELLVTSYSGGAHCCETLHVWSLEAKSPRKILEYAAGNAAGFDLRDLDGDGRQELLLGDDTFAYFGDLCYACSPMYVPLVACSVDRGFQDCTRKFPELVRSWLGRYLERLGPPTGPDDVPFVEGAALGVLALSSLLGEDEKGLETVRAAVKSDEVVRWLERARPQVRDWLDARGKKLKDGKQ
jgi:hypothetical protein